MWHNHKQNKNIPTSTMMMKQPASSAFLRIVALCLILLSSSSTRTAVRAFTQPTRIAATATVNSQSSSSSSSSCCTTIPAKPSIAGTQRASSISTADPAATTATTTGVAPWERVRGSVSSAASNMNALRKRIAKQGIVTALSYSLVSNAFTSVFLGAAWYGFSVQSGLSPLSPGQWKPFLGWYAGFYAINSLLKPVRFVLALGVAPHTNQFMWFLQERFQFSKSLAVASSTAALMIISGGLIATAISVASLASGTPVVPSSMLN